MRLRPNLIFFGLMLFFMHCDCVIFVHYARIILMTKVEFKISIDN